jgi:hypothetical protein
VKNQLVKVCFLWLSTVGILVGCGDAGNDGTKTPGAAGSPGGTGAAGAKGGAGATGSAGATGAFNSTLADTTKLSSLGAADATKLCQEMNAWDLANEMKQGTKGCRLQGEVSARAALGGGDAAGSVGGAPATDADLQAACQQGYDDCLKGQILVVQPDCKKPSFTTGPCTATVAEAETCKNEIAALYQDSLDHALACKDITAAKLQSSGSEPTLGAGCIAIATKCPSFLDIHVGADVPLGGAP